MKKFIPVIIVIILSTAIVLAAGGGSGGKSTIKKQETIPIQPAPQEEPKCSHLNTMKDRILCRLEKIKEGKETEFDPEECRSMPESKKNACRRVYSAANSCWSLKSDKERATCLKQFLQIKSVKEEKEKCLKLKDKTECIEKLKESTFTLIKFKFYNLEEKAEYFLKEGAPLNTVGSFITSIEQKKQEFNQASAIDKKKQIINEVKSLWNEFINQIKDQVK